MGNCHFKTDFDAENITAVSKSSFSYQFCIGKGGFGKVWKVDRKKQKKEYAMKEMSKSRILTKRSVKSVMNERQILTQLHNPFLVNMYYAFQDRESLYLVMDLLNGGDLRYHICKYRRFDEETTRFFTACLVAGLEYCHEKQIIHRDIKPENLVIDDEGYVRVTDFGIARIWRPENAQDTSGTPGYMAPEVMCRQNHTTSVDYFAVGVMAYECMYGRRPYVGKSRKEIRDHILSKQVQIKKGEVPRGWSIEAADFINKMIQRKPTNRLGNGGSAEVKNHPWLRDFPWQDLYDKRLRAPFIPPLEDNFDQKNINEEWKDLDDPEFKENVTNLRRPSVQAFFNGYYYDHQLAALAQNQAVINTGIESKQQRTQEQEKEQSILNNPELILQQFNHQISLHQQQQTGSQPTLHISTNLSSLQGTSNGAAPPSASQQSQSQNFPQDFQSQDSQINLQKGNSMSKKREMSGNLSQKQKMTQQQQAQWMQQQNSSAPGGSNFSNMTMQQQQQIERSFRQSQQLLNQQNQTPANIRTSHIHRASLGQQNSQYGTSSGLPSQGGSIQSVTQQQNPNKSNHIKNISSATNSNSGQVNGSTNFSTMTAKQQLISQNAQIPVTNLDQNSYSSQGHNQQLIPNRQSMNGGAVSSQGVNQMSNGINPYQNNNIKSNNKSMPNSNFHSNQNSPSNTKSMMGVSGAQQKSGNYMTNTNTNRTNSRSNANSIQGSPSKHQKALSMNIVGSQQVGNAAQQVTSKHPILANKQQKIQQQMQFKQILASQQQQQYQQNVVGGQNGGFKSIVHFAKSECPTPKQRVIDDGRKGLTQARFFSRKNSNSNQLIQSQNNSIKGQQNGQNTQQQNANYNQIQQQMSQGSNTGVSQQSRHGFSPQQQQQLKLQKQLQQIQMRKQNGGQIIAGHQLMQGVPKNGFMISQSGTNSATHSRRTSQKSGKSAGANNSNYQTQGQPANNHQQLLQSSQNSNAFKNMQMQSNHSKQPGGINIYNTQQTYNHQQSTSQTGNQNGLGPMMINNNNIYQTQSHHPTNSLSHTSMNQRPAPPDSSTSIHTSQLRDSLQSTGNANGSGQPQVSQTVLHQSSKYNDVNPGQERVQQSGHYTAQQTAHRKQNSFITSGSAANPIMVQQNGVTQGGSFKLNKNSNVQAGQGTNILINQNNLNNRDTTNTTKNTTQNNGNSAMGGPISIDAYQNNFQ